MSKKVGIAAARSVVASLLVLLFTISLVNPVSIETISSPSECCGCGCTQESDAYENQTETIEYTCASERSGTECIVFGCCESSANKTVTVKTKSRFSFRQEREVAHSPVQCWASFLRHTTDDISATACYQRNQSDQLPTFSTLHWRTIRFLC